MTQTNDPPLISSIDLIPDAAEKADLDAPNTSGGKLVVGQAPNITITETTVVADADERLALDVQEGDIAIQTNVSTSFIFTGGDNIAPNWEVLDFDAVGAIDGEDINPRDITPRDITASGDISLQDLTVAGSINGADTSAAAAGEALTSDGSGSLAFASVGGIEEVATFGDLPAIDPPQIGYVTGEEEYYFSTPVTGTPYDITSSEFSLDTDIAPQDTSMQSIAFNDDGSRLYELSGNVDRIYQSTLSTRFDIDTASFDTDIPSQNDNPAGIAWNDDGSRLYEVGSRPERIYQYTVSTPYDISTASLDTDIAPQDSDPEGIAWNDDGSRMYTVGIGSKRIYQYTVSTPYDIATASLDTDIPTQDVFSRDIAWNDDGSRLYETGTDSDRIYQYTVSTPYDIDTASFDTDIPSQGGGPTGIAWNNDGSKLYEINRGFDQIYQSTVSTGGWEAF